MANAFYGLKTDDMPFISSVHGHQRRAQRDITKRDLQAAVKYGVKEQGYPHRRTGAPRWKYTYNDVVYITDWTSTIEVTSWALELPISKVEVAKRAKAQHEEAKRRLKADPSIITSHTVLVVDMSGSMNKSDMNGHRTRSRGVYYSLAEEYVANQLGGSPDSNSSDGGNVGVSYTDVVTLIEMRSHPTVIFEDEPISWILYNRLVERAEAKDASDHGNYYNAMMMAFNCLNRHSHEKCSLALLLFSDGRPSDRAMLGPSLSFQFPENLYNLMRVGCSLYRDRLSFSASGYGSVGDFDILQQLTAIAKMYGAKSAFVHGSANADGLRTAITSLVTSLTETRTLLSRLTLNPEDHKRVRTVAEREVFVPFDDLTNFQPANWRVYNSSTQAVTISRKDLEWKDARPPRKGFEVVWRDLLPFVHPLATGFAVAKKYFGEGAERSRFFGSSSGHASCGQGKYLHAGSQYGAQEGQRQCSVA